MPLAQWRTYRERARQKRNVLHMLALSGVIRPSHIELRYSVPVMNSGTTRTGSGARSANTVQPALALLKTKEPTSGGNTRGSRLLQWLRRGLTAPL
jgi:hypothetical protein